MRIVHICISAPYIDGWGYQENLLPKYLQKAGMDNYVIAPANVFPDYVNRNVVDRIKSKGCAYDDDGIKVFRIQTRKISTSLIITTGLSEVLERIRPDVIFHHNFNCTSMLIAARYSKNNGIPLLVDNHADTINMSKNRLWAFIYYKCLIRVSTRWAQSEILQAYGVTRSRCDFIHDYYGLTNAKIRFLPIGADVDLADSIGTVSELRCKYGMKETDFLIVSGGKLGKGKGTDKLIRASMGLQKEYPQIKLILFGLFEDSETEQMAKDSPITVVHPWCDRIKTLELLKMSDVACWPIHHTTLIEDAVSVGTPIVIRKTETTRHLIDGNGIWLESVAESSIKDALLEIINMNKERKDSLLQGCEAVKRNISYHSIAQQIISDIDGLGK